MTPDTHWRFDDILYGYKPKSLEPAQRQEVIDALELELQRRSDISNPSVFDPHTATDMADRLKRWRKLSGEAADATRATLTAGKAFEDASDMAAGLTAVLWLEDLFLRYREAGLHAEAARVEQTIRHRAIDARNEMTQASVPVDIPPEQIEKWAEEVTGQNLQEGLSQIALQGLRKEAVTRDSVTKMMKESAFLPFMPITLAGPGGFTEATVGPLKDDPDGHAFLQAGRLLGWNSPFLNLAFRHVRKKYGITADHIIAHVRQCPFFAEERMPLLKAGIESWLADAHTSAVHILVPQVEAALRDCLITIGGVTLKPNKNGGFHVITMGDILTDPVFKEHFPGDLRFHLRALYTDTRGLNIRNHLAHGLMHPSLFGVGLANLVIHSILLIAELRLSPATQSSNSPAAQNGASTS